MDHPGPRRFLAVLMLLAPLALCGFIGLLFVGSASWTAPALVITGVVAFAGTAAWLGIWLFLKAFAKHWNF